MKPRYLLLLGAVILCVAAYSVFWYMAASGARKDFTAWADAANAQGFAIAYDDVSVDGYPFRLITRVGKLDWGFPTAGGMAHWRSENLLIVGEPWEPGHIVMLLNGKQDVEVPAGETTHRYSIEAARARASFVTPQDGGPSRFSFASEHLDIANAATGEHVTAGVAQLYLLQMPPSPAPKSTSGQDPALPVTAQVDVRIEDATLPKGKGGTLGQKIESFEAEGVVHGPLAGAGAAQLQQWASAGGTMDVAGLSVKWGDFAMQAGGTVALDNQNRPLGAFEARFQGLDDALNALANFENVPADTMRLAQTTLRAIKPEKDGSWLTVPFTMQNGYLYMGPLPLAQLSPVVR